METTFAGKTVAFCTSSLTIRLSRNLWAGIRGACDVLGVNTLCYTGELLYPEGDTSGQDGGNIIYDFIDKNRVDGIIVYTADIGELVGQEPVQELCKKFPDIPIVSISWELKDIPTIAIDNYGGMYTVISHLIEEHGYRDIAFVKGPEDNSESLERFDAYCDVLKEHNIEIDPALICEGNFSRKSGRKAVETLFDVNKVVVQAIASVDDETALGVADELLVRGYSIPDDIAMTGFDNETFSAVMGSPLTTVEQPLYREGELAVETLGMLWAGDSPKLIYKAPTDLVIRASCGCEERAYHGIPAMHEQSLTLGVNDTLDAVVPDMQILLRKIALEQDWALSEKVVNSLVNALVDALKLGDDSTFSHMLHETLMSISTRGGSITQMHQVFNHFHEIGSSTLSDSAMKRFENILHRARVMNSSVAERVHRQLRIESVEKLIELGDVNYELNTQFTRDNLPSHFEGIAQGNFERLGIKSFYLALYDSPKTPLQSSTLHFVWEKGRARSVKMEKSYPTRELLPDFYKPILRKRHLSIAPLFFKGDQSGYIVAETAVDDAMVCDIVSWQISSALNRVELMCREERRRMELEASLAQLKNTQKQLIEAEKMASLGNLVAGVAHEINTPVGASVTYASYLQEITETLEKSFKEGSVTKTAFAEYLEKGLEVSRGLLINLNRSADLIRSFKEVAVDQSRNEKRTVQLKHYLDEILLSLHAKINQKGHEVLVECSKEIELYCYAGALSQVITNLVMNSMLHGFPAEMSGTMKIAVEEGEDTVTILFSDNGIGMTPKVRSQIFEPFFTTKRNEGGSGLGMHIVHNLVTQSLGGEIVCESEEGKGVEFRIVIPKK